MNKIKEAEVVIRNFGRKADGRGGQAELARQCGCTLQAIHQWKAKGIPKLQRKWLLLAFPDAFLE